MIIRGFAGQSRRLTERAELGDTRLEQRAVLRRTVRAFRLWVQAGQTQQATAALVTFLQSMEDELT